MANEPTIFRVGQSSSLLDLVLTNNIYLVEDINIYEYMTLLEGVITKTLTRSQTVNNDVCSDQCVYVCTVILHAYTVLVIYRINQA